MGEFWLREPGFFASGSHLLAECRFLGSHVTGASKHRKCQYDAGGMGCATWEGMKTIATRQAASSEYRAAKAHLESLLGVSYKGLQSALERSYSNMSEPSRYLPCAIKLLYKCEGADVSPDALRTLAYARLARSFDGLLACGVAKAA